jgi:hypothetical protein
VSICWYYVLAGGLFRQQAVTLSLLVDTGYGLLFNTNEGVSNCFEVLQIKKNTRLKSRVLLDIV